MSLKCAQLDRVFCLLGSTFDPAPAAGDHTNIVYRVGRGDSPTRRLVRALAVATIYNPRPLAFIDCERDLLLKLKVARLGDVKAKRGTRDWLFRCVLPMSPILLVCGTTTSIY